MFYFSMSCVRDIFHAFIGPVFLKGTGLFPELLSVSRSVLSQKVHGAQL